MNDIMQEIRLSRDFSCAFYDALVAGKVEVPAEVIEKFQMLKKYHDEQMSREMS
jgi:hypothetical protein